MGIQEKWANRGDLPGFVRQFAILKNPFFLAD
jgi:hypothetical protein